MKKTHFFKLKLAFLLSLVGFLLLGYLNKVSAGYIPIDDEPCTSDQECNQRYGTEGVRCLSIGSAGKQCYQFVQPTMSGSLQKFTEQIAKDRQAGTMSQESWIGDPERGSIPNILNAISLQIVGTGGSNPSGALGITSSMISYLITTPPVSTKEYLADIGKSLGLTKVAYAQGIGFSGFSNLIPLWKGFRNLAYIFFVIIFLFIGLAIMFRVKIDPKTVITIQNAIPKIVISLILVTFSYAIVGLLIDLIYVILFLSSLIFTGFPGGPGNNTFVAQQKLTNLNFFTVYNWAANIIYGQSPIALIFGIKTNNFTSTLVKLIPVIGPIDSLLTAILDIIVLFLILRLFFSLVISYIMIIINTIFAPIILMMGAIPGSKSTFGGWIRNLLSNILIFPAVAIFFYLIQILVASNGPTWVPPVLGFSGETLTMIIGLGGLFLINRIPDIIKGYFAGRPFTEYGTAIGQALAPVAAGVGLAQTGAKYAVAKRMGVREEDLPKAAEGSWVNLGIRAISRRRAGGGQAEGGQAQPANIQMPEERNEDGTYDW